jgi:hypothetical protein
MIMTIHLHPAERFRISGAILLLSLYDFMTWARTLIFDSVTVAFIVNRTQIDLHMLTLPF